MVEGELAAVARQHRQPYSALDHQINLAARIAAREDHLIGLELGAPHAAGNGRAVLLVEGAEQGRPRQQFDDRFLVHVAPFA
jgi:hypothetical protein